MKSSKQAILDRLSQVKDPEIPVLNVVEMGIVRDVAIGDDGVEVAITPTYSGCPAMDVIERDIVGALQHEGLGETRVKTVYAPPWTTDWMTDEAKRKLKQYGIAPPPKTCGNPADAILDTSPVACPFCDAAETELRSPFGSTACKALYFCNQCRQPFEQFKCI